MAKGIFARFFGVIAKNNNKQPTKQRQEQPIKRARIEVTSPTPPPKPQSQSISSITVPANVQQPIIDKEDNSHYLFSDIKDKLTDMNDFINTRGSNDINLHLQNLNNLKDRVSYKETNTNDEFSTLSSSTSSSLSLQDALFSHFSNTDTQSEISNFSNDYKIIVGSQKESPSSSHYDSNGSLFDRRFSVADTNSTTSQTFHNTLTDYTNALVSQENESLHFEKQFCDMYIDALRFLSMTTPEQSPARAFTLFEFIANKGYQEYQKLNSRTKHLVSFAQYRAGRMLYESSTDDDKMKKHGLLYLVESSKNGNARAAFILGFYAERRGEIDHACQLYYQAAMAGILPAKVSFGTVVLFSSDAVSGFKTNDAIYMLEEASSEVTPFPQILSFFSSYTNISIFRVILLHLFHWHYIMKRPINLI